MIDITNKRFIDNETNELLKLIEARGLYRKGLYLYDVEKYNIYAQFGAGFIIPVGKPFLSFELRYSHGLVDFNQYLVQLGASNLSRTKLTSMNFVVGLQIPLGSSDIYLVKKKIR